MTTCQLVACLFLSKLTPLISILDSLLTPGILTNSDIQRRHKELLGLHEDMKMIY
jgi:hypothetical protein